MAQLHHTRYAANNGLSWRIWLVAVISCVLTYLGLCWLLQLQVPNETVGRIIGRGGSNLTQIRQLSGARLDVAQQDPSGATTTRIITITGVRESPCFRYYFFCGDDNLSPVVSISLQIQAPRSRSRMPNTSSASRWPRYRLPTCSSVFMSTALVSRRQREFFKTRVCWILY